MTDEEFKLKKAFYGEKKCPDCGASRLDFLKGPRGGEAVNIKCSKCGSEFNVCAIARFIERI